MLITYFYVRVVLNTEYSWEGLKKHITHTHFPVAVLEGNYRVRNIRMINDPWKTRVMICRTAGSTHPFSPVKLGFIRFFDGSEGHAKDITGQARYLMP